MDSGDFPGECLCGSIDFERIVVQRKPNPPITTDFVACLACRAMYFRAAAADRRNAAAGTDQRRRDRRAGRGGEPGRAEVGCRSSLAFMDLRFMDQKWPLRLTYFPSPLSKSPTLFLTSVDGSRHCEGVRDQ
jgi:hypothetical protein